MIRIVIFAYLIVLVFGKSGSDFVEESLSSESRIVGGRTARLGQFPYQVSLRTFYPTNFHFCGGILASDSWIVSAAHCTIDKLSSNIFIVVGTISRIHGGDKYNTERIFNHPNYNSSNINFDISILLTTQKITLNKNIRPIALGSKYVKGGVFAVVSGWGRTSNQTDSAAEVLQYLKVLIISNAKCKKKVGHFGHTIFENKICHYGIWKDRGHCHGDSGGPLVAKHTAIGIVSWNAYHCADGLAGVYERISSHRNWIMKIFFNKQ